MKHAGSERIYPGTLTIYSKLKERLYLLEPPPNRAAWQWAEAKRELPKGSAEPGPFRASRAPWIKTLTERVRDPRHDLIVAVMGSQMSKTDGVLLNLIGWKLDDDPQPILYIGPTQKNVESIAGSAQKGKGRVGQMIRSVPSLWSGLAKGKDEKITEKFINGVRLGFGWAGSATELASHPAALGLLDEYDRMDPVPGEGDPLGLLEARTSTYPNGTNVVTSTPLEGEIDTIALDTGLTHWAVADPDKILSPTWLLWQMSTRHEWAWPCPDCHRYFIPRSSLLWYPEDATPQQALKLTRLTCPHCGSQIEDRSKTDMNAHGVAVAPGQAIDNEGVLSGDEAENNSFGLWVSGLCSEWRTWGQRLARYLTAKQSGDAEKVRTAVNTGYGELFARDVARLPWQHIQNLTSGYARGHVPPGIYRISATVDVQKNRLVYSVRGWIRFRSWLIEAGELYGDTEKMPVWDSLGKLLYQQWNGRAIDVMLIDEGYLKDHVHRFCKQHITKAAPCKGVESLDLPYKASGVETDEAGKKLQTGMQRYLFESSRAKAWVHAQISDGQEQTPQW